MKNIIQFNNKKAWSAAVAAVMFLMLLAPVNMASAADPVPVDGMIIPTSMTGDSSAWVEIAHYGDYMLIIRQSPITNELKMYRYMSAPFRNAYADSDLYTGINNWYTSTLPQGARLREFAVGSNSLNNYGFFGTITTTGQSKPNGTPAPTGKDVAFALSFSEALYFCSTQYQLIGTNAGLKPKSYTVEAYSNFHKLLPKYGGGGQGDNPAPAFWLRTPGTDQQYAGAVAFQGGSPTNDVVGRLNQHTIIGTYGHYRPAMWVSKDLIIKEKVKVTYDPNGGEGSVNEESVNVNTNYTIKDQGYTRGMIKQTGWNTQADGKGTPYSNGNVVHMTASLTLYAQWGPVWIVTYDPNGGVGNIVTDPAYSNFYKVRDQDYYHINSDYKFDVWNTQANGNGTDHSIGDEIYITGDITLYAKWKYDPKLVKVTYYPNGGIGAVKSDEQPRNTVYTVVSQNYYHSILNYIFDGWNTQANGKGEEYLIGSKIVLVDDIDLYAQWKLKPAEKVLVIYEPNGGVGERVEVEVDKDSYYEFEDMGYTMDLFNFASWNTAPNGHGVTRNISEKITVTDHMILYAQWKRKL